MAKTMNKLPLSIILDSGAFGAWKRGVEIDPRRYVDFVKENEEYLFAHVSLDAIPGGVIKSKVASDQEIVDCAKHSYETHQWLKRKELRPIPVFHQGDPFVWLERYLADGETYIGISPYLRAGTKAIRIWLDKCFTRLTNTKGFPIVRTHGFGMTTTELLIRFPWYSVDSTRWVITGAYGSVNVPGMLRVLSGLGGYDFTKGKLFTLTHRRNDRANNFDAQPRIFRQAVSEYFASIDLDLELLRHDDKARYKASLIFNQRLSEQIGRVTFRPGYRHHDLSSKEGLHIPAVKIFAATTPALPKNEALNETGTDDRLLSYWDIREQPAHFLSNYFKTGLPLGRGKTRYDKAKRLAAISEKFLEC